MKVQLLIYSAFFFSTISWGQISFENFIIDNTLDGANSVFAADIDGDGDLDVLFTAYNASQVGWYENLDGQGNFGDKIVLSDSAGQAIFVYAEDLDGDNDIDVISASTDDSKIAWYENMDGLGTFGVEQVLSLNASLASSVYADDLDGDGDMDVLSASRNDDKLAWYENQNGIGDFSLEKIISLEADRAYSVHAEDLDGDGDKDVLSAYGFNGEIAWFENTDGLGNFSTANVIDSDLVDSKSCYAGDIDGDGYMDAIVIEDKDIKWYKNVDGLGSFSEPIFINETSSINGGESVFATDMDNDGDLDVLAAFRWSDKIAWYENIDGLGHFGNEIIITTDANSARSVYAADLNGDGFKDVLSASLSDDKIAWYKNSGPTNNKIIGRIEFANNGSCDTATIPASNILVNASNGTETFSTFSLSNGRFQIYLDEGDFTTSPEVSDYFTINPNSHNSSFQDIGNVDTLNFCLESSQENNDLNISLYPILEARPGFNAQYKLVFNNVGSTTMSGMITVEFDELKLEFLQASEPVSIQSNSELTFEYNELLPFESRSINLTFYVPVPPMVNIGDTLIFLSTINPTAQDYAEEDNQFILRQVVIGSFDPNDIRVLEGPQITTDETNHYLHYIIRFQNTGTAEAINVRIENTLDNHLDWNSLKMESMSHPGTVQIFDGNHVVFNFKDINLPDSTSNEPGSHGFVAYKIKPSIDIDVGNVIYNNADIFFDFNPPINTNTVSTEVIMIVSIDNLEGNILSISPVPASDYFKVETTIPVAQINIYNHLGQLVRTEFNKMEIDISQLKDGTYFCQVFGRNGKILAVKKVLKIK